MMRPYVSAPASRLLYRLLSTALFVSCMAAALAAAPSANPTAGSVKAMLPDASRNAHPLAVNDSLQWNDVLQTDAKGRVRAVLNDGSILSVGSNSQLKIVQHDAAAQQTAIDLDYGKLRNQVTKITQPQGKYQVKTSNAVIGVIGTDFYVDYAKGRTTVICYEGKVSVTPVNQSKVLGSTDVPVASDGSVTLRSGQIVIFGPKIARDETLLYPVLMEAGLKDTEVTMPQVQGGNVGDGSRTGTQASQAQPSSTDTADNSHNAGAPTGGAVTSTAEPVSKGSKDTTNNSRVSQSSPAPASPNEAIGSNDKPQTPDEAQLVQLINKTRSEKGLPPLDVDPRLTEAAREHTLLMVQNGALSHQFPGEPVLQDRFDAVKLPSDYAAENVAWDTSVIAAHQSLIGDPSHLRNILSAQAGVVGVAVIRSGDHVFITEDFAHIMAPDPPPQQ